MVHCSASGGQAHLRGQQPETDEVVPRIEFDFAELGREEDQVLPIPSLNAVDVGSESLSATLCPNGKRPVSNWWKSSWRSKHLDTVW